MNPRHGTLLVDGGRVSVAGNVAVRLAFIVLMVASVIWRDLPQFADIAMQARWSTYPLALFVVPALWWFGLRRLPGPQPYPHVADALVVLVFVVDLAGNAADMYRTYPWFDNLAHFTNPILATVAAVQLVSRLPVPRWQPLPLGVVLVIVLHTFWEIIEYWLMDYAMGELALTQHDTIQDLTYGLAGTLVGAAFAASWLRRSRRMLRR
jgi:uncharacterized membrane protein YjdF